MAPRSVTLRDARGTGAVLRITDHPEHGQVILSHWRGEVCVASTPIEHADIAALVEFLNTAGAPSATDSPARGQETSERRLLAALRYGNRDTRDWAGEPDVGSVGDSPTGHVLVDPEFTEMAMLPKTGELRIGRTGDDVA